MKGTVAICIALISATQGFNAAEDIMKPLRKHELRLGTKTTTTNTSAATISLKEYTALAGTLGAGVLIGRFLLAPDPAPAPNPAPTPAPPPVEDSPEYKAMEWNLKYTPHSMVTFLQDQDYKKNGYEISAFYGDFIFGVSGISSNLIVSNYDTLLPYASIDLAAECGTPGVKHLTSIDNNGVKFVVAMQDGEGVEGHLCFLEYDDTAPKKLKFVGKKENVGYSPDFVFIDGQDRVCVALEGSDDKDVEGIPGGLAFGTWNQGETFQQKVVTSIATGLYRDSVQGESCAFVGADFVVAMLQENNAMMVHKISTDETHIQDLGDQPYGEQAMDTSKDKEKFDLSDGLTNIAHMPKGAKGPCGPDGMTAVTDTVVAAVCEATKHPDLGKTNVQVVNFYKVKLCSGGNTFCDATLVSQTSDMPKQLWNAGVYGSKYDDKGWGMETAAIKEIGGKKIMAVTLGKADGIVMYDVTDVLNPKFVHAYEMPGKSGLAGPEGLIWGKGDDLLISFEDCEKDDDEIVLECGLARVSTSITVLLSASGR